MQPGDSHYDTLGVSPTAGSVELRAAYLRLARRYHPDFHVGDDVMSQADAAEHMRDVNAAWHVLGHAERRNAYDRQLRRSHQYAARQAATTTSAPEPSSGHRPSRLVQTGPPAALGIAIVLLLLGFVTDLTVFLASGFALALCSGVLFLAVPMIAMGRSRHDGSGVGR